MRIGSVQQFAAQRVQHRQLRRREIRVELLQGLGFDLPHALARQADLLADFLERQRLAVIEAEAELENLRLAAIDFCKQHVNRFDFIASQHDVVGRLRFFVVQQFVQRQAVFLGDVRLRG